MATFRWLGDASAVAQVATVQVTAYDAATTYKITVGDAVASAVGNTSANQTATDLSGAWNALTHPHATGITASVATDTVTLTADTAGVPFTAVSSVSAGNGTIGNVTVTTANAGPASAQTLANWLDTSTGTTATALPGGNDTIVFEASGTHCAYDLDALTGGPDVIEDITYTGRIGLPETVFTTSADAETTVTTAREYRKTHLELPYDTAVIGRWNGLGSPSGSGRVKIKNTKAGASTTTVRRTGSTTADVGKPAIRLLAAHADADVYIESAAAGVGIGADAPGEAPTVGDIYVTDTTSSSRLVVGPGVTMTSLTTQGGISRVLGAAATVASIDALGGTLYLDGDWTCTALTVDGATVYDAHTKTAGNATTTATLRSGTLDWQVSREARTVNALVHTGGTLRDTTAVTVTTDTPPALSTRTAS